MGFWLWEAPMYHMKLFSSKGGSLLRREADLVRAWLGGVWKLDVLGQSWDLRQVLQFELMISGGKKDFLWLYLKLICSSSRIWHLTIMKFFGGSCFWKEFRKWRFECGGLSHAMIADFLEQSLRVVFMHV